MTAYHFIRDSHHRHRTEIAPGLTVGFKMLAEDHARRIENGVHAYIVLDMVTPLGLCRTRDIRVMWSRTRERFFIRWKSWSTGKIRDGKEEWLDVFGPLDVQSREKFEAVFVEAFLAIREQAAAGTLGKPPVVEREFIEEPSEAALGDQPALAGALENISARLQSAEGDDDEVGASADGEQSHV